jgi:superfamily II DNA/RNA helicase
MEHPNRFPDLTDPGKFVDILPGKRTGKIERLDLHITNHVENGTPVVVFAALVPQQQEIHRLMQELGLSCGLLNGSTSRADRDHMDKAFTRGDLQGLIVSPKVADVGFNWQDWKDQEVQHAIFASLDYQDTTFFQAYRRFMRRTRKSALRITVMEYARSLDQKIRSIVNRKFRDAHLVDPTRELIQI